MVNCSHFINWMLLSTHFFVYLKFRGKFVSTQHAIVCACRSSDFEKSQCMPTHLLELFINATLCYYFLQMSVHYNEKSYVLKLIMFRVGNNSLGLLISKILSIGCISSMWSCCEPAKEKHKGNCARLIFNNLDDGTGWKWLW